MNAIADGPGCEDWGLFNFSAGSVSRRRIRPVLTKGIAMKRYVLDSSAKPGFGE
jgi:hypothetical protein